MAVNDKIMSNWLKKFIAKNPVIINKIKKIKKANKIRKSNKEKQNGYRSS